jgi:hypothetical protein
MRTKTNKVTIDNYFLGQDDLDKTMDLILEENNSKTIYINKEKYEITEEDKDKTLEEFMREHNIKTTEIQQYGHLHTCAKCKRSDVEFGNPHSIHCRPCHNEYMADYRKKVKEGHVPKKIKKKHSHSELIRKIEELELQMNEIKERVDMVLDKLL